MYAPADPPTVHACLHSSANVVWFERQTRIAGLEVDPANEQLKGGLEEAKAAKDRPAGGRGAGPPGASAQLAAAA